MATVDITINGRIFKVTCDAGQEDRLQSLAYWADERLQMIANEVGQIGDTRLLLLTLLMVCDELFELKDRQSQAGGDAGNGLDGTQLIPSESLAEKNAREAAAIRKLEEVTRRVRSLSENVS